VRDVGVLIQQARDLGANFVLEGDRVRVRAPSPLPEQLLSELRSFRSQVAAALRQEHSGDIHFGCLKNGAASASLIGGAFWLRLAPMVTRKGR